MGMNFFVTPYAGVRIEITEYLSVSSSVRPVTPYAGVWIEITLTLVNDLPIVSLPTRECGLKLNKRTNKFPLIGVTPYAGVRIEIS